MFPFLPLLLAASLCAASCLPAIAQTVAATAEENAVEVARLHELWRTSKVPDERRRYADEILKLEPKLERWPLQVERSRAVLDYHFSVGHGYQLRTGRGGDSDVEAAIEAYEKVVLGAPAAGVPKLAAMAQHNLGLIYLFRKKGTRSFNIEKAKQGFEAALTVRTKVADPIGWAQSQTGLGRAYYERIVGSDPENMERAIAAFEAALTVQTKQKAPEEWALLQQYLAAALNASTVDYQQERFKRAIAATQEAMTVRTREKHPETWASLQVLLGNHYGRLRTGDRAKNIERQIEAYEAARSINTREKNPKLWGGATQNLGNAFANRLVGDKAENIDRAIALYEQAVQVRPRDSDPLNWAMTMSNLGIKYSQRINGDRAANLATSESLLSEVVAAEVNQEPHLKLSRLAALAHTVFQQGKWAQASKLYGEARSIFRDLLRDGTDEAAIRLATSSANLIFQNASFAAAELGEADVAIGLANEGKARLLAAALRSQTLIFTAPEREKADRLRIAIRAMQRDYENTSGVERKAVLDKISALRLELTKHIRMGVARRQPEQPVKIAANLVPKRGAVVVPVATKMGGKLLIYADGEGGRKLSVVNVPDLSTDNINRIVRGGPAEAAGRGWIDAFGVQHLPEGERAGRDGEWIEAIESVGPALGKIFGSALDAQLRKSGIRNGARVLWLPTGALGILPMGLARDPTGTRRLGETYDIAYVPSFEALTSADMSARSVRTPSLAAAVNPTGEDQELALPFTEVEGAIVASHFKDGQRTVLDKTGASPEAVLASLKDRTYWHFSSHGTFDWNDVHNAGLLMRGRKLLTIEALKAAEGQLGRPRLVVLSACETGISDINSNPDEFIGLPATFVQLGATGVVSTLWQVDDLATALLMARFYDEHLAHNQPPSRALKMAQGWLATASRRDLVTFVKTLAHDGRLKAQQLGEIEAILETGARDADSRFAAIGQRVRGYAADGKASRPDEASNADAAADAQPFAHPYYWGGFVYTGL